MKCLICNSETNKNFDVTILNKYKSELRTCTQCHFSFFHNPTWIDEAYEESINLTDTGASQRSIENSKNLSILLYFGVKASEQEVFLDYGGGHGLLTRLMRDTGWNWKWYDPYTKNILAKGFSEEALSTYKLISSFETFEHFPNPIEEISKIIKLSENVFFSTELVPGNPPPEIDQWDYYAPNHGQHICFYSLESLQYLANKFNKHLYSNGSNIHYFSNKQSWKLKLIFKLLKNKRACKLIRELFFLYIKMKKTSKTIEDSIFLENKRIIESEK